MELDLFYFNLVFAGAQYVVESRHEDAKSLMLSIQSHLDYASNYVSLSYKDSYPIFLSIDKLETIQQTTKEGAGKQTRIWRLDL